MTLQALQFFLFQSSVLHVEYIFYSVLKTIQTHEIDCFVTSLLALRPWRFSLHRLKRTSFRAVVFSVLGMPRNHMALSPGYMEDVLVLSHQFQSVLPMPQQQYVAGHYPGAKNQCFLSKSGLFFLMAPCKWVFRTFA